MKINIDSHSLNFYSDCLKPNNCKKYLNMKADVLLGLQWGDEGKVKL